MNALSLSALSFGLFLSACDSQKGTTVAVEKKRWTDQGWTYVETVGTATDDARFSAHMNAHTASSMSAFAVTDGKQSEKKFPQNQMQYLVVTMVRPSGDQYALVFAKPKP